MASVAVSKTEMPLAWHGSSLPLRCGCSLHAEWKSSIVGGYALIPFQFGYAVNVISESYIVIPGKAGIHTGWLGRTW